MIENFYCDSHCVMHRLLMVFKDPPQSCPVSSNKNIKNNLQVSYVLFVSVLWECMYIEGRKESVVKGWEYYPKRSNNYASMSIFKYVIFSEIIVFLIWSLNWQINLGINLKFQNCLFGWKNKISLGLPMDKSAGAK